MRQRLILSEFKIHTEKALSNRGKCWACGNKISKDEIKLVLEENPTTTKKSFCKFCVLKVLEFKLVEFKRLFGELENDDKKTK